MRPCLTCSTLFFLASCWLPVVGAAADWQVELTVSAGTQHRRQTPVSTLVEVPPALADHQMVVLEDAQGNVLAGQLTPPGLLSPANKPARRDAKTVARQLHVILPDLPAGQSKTWKVSLAKSDDAPAGFRWHDTPGESRLLSFDGRPVLQYMYAALDDSSPATREQTYKVFHHLYDPSGSRRVTKGPGGRYTHHRGLFYGFNRISYGDGHQVDTWHCKGDAHLAHADFLSAAAGPVVGRHQVTIDWHGVGKEVFARERREMTVYNLPGGLLVEFASRLTGEILPVQLDGDPQHAGFQFRASNEIAERTNSLTYYLRPDGQGSPGETRNWPQDENHINLPWNTMSFVLGDERYTAVYLDHPRNPKPARYSERDYGRFGSYFVYELNDEKPLELNYRVWLQAGEITDDEVSALSAGFVEPPEVDIR